MTQPAAIPPMIIATIPDPTPTRSSGLGGLLGTGPTYRGFTACTRRSLKGNSSSI
jgi:hypothetical protein